MDELAMVVESHRADPDSIYSGAMRREAIFALGKAGLLGPYCGDLPRERAALIEYVNGVIRPQWDQKQKS
jgi:hypothetical protein